MVCECGNVLNENAAFCSKCGKKVEKQEQSRFCTNCGSKVKSDAVFCDSCGNRVNIRNESSSNVVSNLIMSLEGLSLFKKQNKWTQPIGILKIYNDKVEFVHSGRDFSTSSFAVGGLIGGVVGGIISSKMASERVKQTDVVDTYDMTEISIANMCKHPKVSVYFEIILKTGDKLRFIHREGKYRVEQMISAVNTINANL